MDEISNVVYLECETRLDIPAKRVIDAIPDELSSIVVIGYTADGLGYFDSSIADGAAVNWLLDRIKAKLLMSIGDE